ncbi:MAG: LytTR family DNA-binding domain-containing protein [Eubacterium sp.]|jgi:DNA-binding LytR/AlgR family response regulator|nr:LytTR family DNA-binding domain-containing protein [Eubacterium sp.]
MGQQVDMPEQKALYYLKKRGVKMRLAICDDDNALIQTLKPVIYQYANSRKFELVIDAYNSGEALLQTQTIYDIILLDYQMGELDGLSTARKLREKNINCAIIFMTNYPHFVYEAFEVSAFRFFEKPLAHSKLYAALDDYFKMHGNDYPILLQHNRETVQVNTKDIVFLEAKNKYCDIHLTRDQMLCAKTMAVISRLLPKNHFYKVNRAFIINLNYISKYNNDEISLKNGEKVHVSRSYLKAFKAAYREYSILQNPRREEVKQ